MKIKDVKILWALSGNRCAICKTELTPVGDAITIGEMAHIVAESDDGPRGKSNSTNEERNSYQNLILLCPNHHSEIDKNETEWTVDKLHRIKVEHEQWVSAQLDLGRISLPSPLNSQEFIQIRKQKWGELSSGKLFLSVAITPLTIDEEIIDPLDSKILFAVQGVSIPRAHTTPNHFGGNRTRPNENGIINEDLRIENGWGYTFQLFRNGHIEYLTCLDGYVNYSTDSVHQNLRQIFFGSKIKLEGKIIPYKGLFESLSVQLTETSKLWNTFLLYCDALITVSLLNTRSTNLYTGRDIHMNTELGTMVESNILELTTVINKSTNPNSLLEFLLKRFSNYYGLVLDKIRDNEQNLELPRYLS